MFNSATTIQANQFLHFDTSARSVRNLVLKYPPKHFLGLCDMLTTLDILFSSILSSFHLVPLNKLIDFGAGGEATFAKKSPIIPSNSAHKIKAISLRFPIF